jgi:uncharacterized protein YheU (UPF0270 family)
MNSQGDALAVWVQSNGSHDMVFLSTRENGAWEDPQSLNDHISPAGSNVLFPCIDINESGDAVVVWDQEILTSCGSLPCRRAFRSYRSNGIWTHPKDLDDFFSLDNPGAFTNVGDVSIDDNGQATIVYTDFDGSNSRVFKSEFDGAQWRDSQTGADALSLVGDNAKAPAVARDNNGHVVIVWCQVIQANLVDSGHYRYELINGTWIGPTKVNLPSRVPFGLYGVALAMSGNGFGLLVWSQPDAGGFFQLFASIFDPSSGNWTPPTDLSDSLSPGGSDAKGSTASISSRGEAVVAWSQLSTTTGFKQVFKAEYRANAWSLPSSSADFISVDVSTGVAKPTSSCGEFDGALIGWVQGGAVFIAQQQNGVWQLPQTYADAINPAPSSAITSAAATNKQGQHILLFSQSTYPTARQVFRSEYQ